MLQVSGAFSALLFFHLPKRGCHDGTHTPEASNELSFNSDRQVHDQFLP